MTGDSIPLRRASRALFGPLVWAAHFIVVYASESLLCRLAEGRAHTILLAAATILAILAVARHSRGHLAGSRGDEVGNFLAGISVTLDALSLVGIVYVAGAGLLLPYCGQFR